MTDYIKDPDAVADYGWDWTRWLVGDTIVNHSIIVSPAAGLTVDASVATDTRVVAWLSGGAEGEKVDVTYRITTAAGRIDDRTHSFTFRHK